MAGKKKNWWDYFGDTIERLTKGQWVMLEKPASIFAKENEAWEKETNRPGVIRWYSDRIDDAVDWMKAYEATPGEATESHDEWNEHLIRASGYVLGWIRQNVGMSVVKPQPYDYIPKGQKRRIADLVKQGYKKVSVKPGLQNGNFPWGME